MHALIDELAAAGARTLRAPLAIVAGASAVPVARTQVHELAVASGVNLLGGACDSRVEAMVEANLDQAPGDALAFDQTLDLRCRCARGLLHQHVGSARKRALGKSGELVVDGGDNDDLWLHREQLLRARARLGTMASGERLRGRRVQVAAAEQDILGRERIGAYRTDAPTADHPHT